MENSKIKNHEDSVKDVIREGRTVLGIELGSTRIKAVLIGEDYAPIASGSQTWENRYEDGIWTYRIEDVWKGLQDSYYQMTCDVKKRYGMSLKTIGAIGFSGMMHGYMAFDKDGKLLVPFRTWRNNITGEAADKLTEVFHFQIPQRWSVAHLYQAMLNQEDHVGKIDYLTTLAGYIHWKLTGKRVLGIGEASGVFPIDSELKTFRPDLVEKFDQLDESRRYSWKLSEILPRVLTAGEAAGNLTDEGTKLLDVSGMLQSGIPLCPPEGDAGTGMAATNSVAKRTGNVSAGTSVFAMVVLEKELSKVYSKLDMVTTPSGDPVAMVHCQNCTSDLNAWVGLFKETLECFGIKPDMDELYGILYRKALEGDPDCGGLLAYNYYSGEHITDFTEGRPLFVRSAENSLNLANFMRVHLSTALGALKVGADILFKEEGVKVDKLTGHGGLFRTKEVGQRILAAAMNTPVSVLKTAGEGGPWGSALLASYMINREEDESLDTFLENRVFTGQESKTIQPDPKEAAGFEAFTRRYKKGLAIERAAVETLL